MSQQPSPYSVPYQYPAGYPYDPAQQLLAPARRAGLLMYVLGGLSLLCGACIGVAVSVIPMGDIIAQIGIEIPQTAELGISQAEFVRILYLILAAMALGVAVVMIVLAVFVRRGGVFAVVTSLVLCSLILLFLLLNTVSTLVQLGSVRNPLQGVFAVVIAAALLSLFGLLFVWLVQAVRATSAIRLARMQFQSQYWQYQQQQQMYAQQGGYGYPQPPPPQLPPNESGERPNGPATPG